jgi:peptidoglycan/LPS O-acetylase OafA/YrhL
LAEERARAILKRNLMQQASKESVNSNRLKGYLPTLDGWRAISILLVIVHHSHFRVSSPLLQRGLNEFSLLGKVGVNIFFAISGLLICSRMLDEEAKYGSISIRKFYLRRAFRILPAAFTYLLFVGLLARVLGVTWLGWLSSLLFFRNYVLTEPWKIWYTAHFWSLAVEEHFYLLLPGLLAFVRRRRALLLGMMALIVAVWRSYYVSSFKLSPEQHTDTVLDALLIPAMLIVLAKDRLYFATFARYLKPATTIALAIAYLGLLLIHVPFYLALRSLVLPLLLLSTCLNDETILGRMLEWAPLRWLGRLSYSLYLWQQLFFYGWDPGSPLGRMQQFPLNILLAMACACASYYLLELPLVRYSHKIASSGIAGRNVEKPAVELFNVA